MKDQQKEMQWTTTRDTERLCDNDDDDDAIKSPILSSNAVTTSSVSMNSSEMRKVHPLLPLPKSCALLWEPALRDVTKGTETLCPGE